MCRIFGVSYGDQREDLDTTEIAMTLFPALVGGGPHAWGWMSYSEVSESITLDKYPGRADSSRAVLNQNEYIDPDAKWLVGHVRFATHGSPEDDRNNHPLPHGNIVGVHNGVLRNHEKILAETGRQDPKTQVDSEAIFAAVNKWGAKAGLSKIEGDMVTIYSDHRKPHVLHIGRTHGRQITLGWTEKGNLIFASEEQALHRLEPEIKFIKFSTVSENRLLIIRNGKIIQRLTFAPPVRRFVAPPATVMARRPLGGISTAQLIVEGELAKSRAERRGEILFPKAPVTSSGKKKGRGKSKRITHPIDEIIDADGSFVPARTPNQNSKLYYFDGELLTYDEYQIAVENRD